MKKLLHRANTRGKGEYGWLSTRYSFGFANWHDPSRVGFGALRVLNDDTIAPASGFPMHGHADMEIITIVAAGTLTHRDNLGNIGTIGAGEVQVMSAGTGIVHSEYNASATESLSLFQLWIQTGERGASPRYGEAKRSDIRAGEITQLAGPLGSGAPATILQNALISRAHISPSAPITYSLSSKDQGLYVFVLDGTLSVEGEKLGSRDAIGVSEFNALEISAAEPSNVLLIEVPML